MPDVVSPSAAGLSLADVLAPITILSNGDQTNFNNLVQQTIQATTIDSASNGVALSTATIYVDSVTSFTATGALWIEALGTTVVYTGRNSTSTPQAFTGCTLGSGTLLTGMAIAQGVPYLTLWRLACLIALVAEFPGCALLAANNVFTGALNTFDSDLQCDGTTTTQQINCTNVVASGNETIAGTLGVAGLSTLGSISCNGAVTFGAASVVLFKNSFHVQAPAAAIVDSGAELNLAAGSLLVANTALVSRTVATDGPPGSAHNYTVDCSISNVFTYTSLDGSEASYTWDLTNAQDGYRGRIYFLMPTIVAPTFAITKSGASVVMFGGSAPSPTAGKWCYWDFTVATANTTDYVFVSQFVQQN